MELAIFDGERSLVDYTNQALQSGAREAEFARICLRKCLEGHEQCKAKSSTRLKPPTRLLNLQHAESNKVCLCLTSGSDAGLKYITLSHRWRPGNHQISLLQSNITQMQDGIEMNSLSQTFQDAINISRDLGIFYLWIDALCIIQDDEIDWATESADMGNVYAGAVLNLSGTAAIDCLYDQRSLRPPLSCYVRLLIDGQSLGFTVYNNYLWHNEVAEAPLSKRAWVLQERLLSPRILHFGKSQSYWECAQYSSSELFPCGNLGSMWNTAFKQNFASVLNFPDSATTEEVHKLWSEVVEMYSRCSLTVGTDKLVAISSIAARLHRKLGKRYLAGLWESFLEQDLLWQRDHREEGCRLRPRPYRAPSWSWASIDAGVIQQPNRDEEAKTLFKLLNAKVQMGHCNKFGHVSDAVLSIACSLAAGYLNYFTAELSAEDVETPHFQVLILTDQAYTYEEGHSVEEDGKMWLRIHEDPQFYHQCLEFWNKYDSDRGAGIVTSHNGLRLHRAGISVNLDIARYPKNLRHDWKWRVAETFKVEVYFLPLRLQSEMIEGLVLVPALGRKQHFQRIGIFRTEKRGLLQAGCRSLSGEVVSQGIMRRDFKTYNGGDFGRQYEIFLI